MITINKTSGEIEIISDDQTFHIDKEADYREFVLWITDPTKGAINSEVFDIDPELEEGSDGKALAERYEAFLKEFLKRRDKIVGENADKIKRGEKKLNDAPGKIEDLKSQISELGYF